MTKLNPKREVKDTPALTALSEEELRSVSGGTSNVYYDVSTGTYILRPAGSVYVGPGVLVGQT